MVLDLTLPEVNGYTCAAAFQAPDGSHVPHVLITAGGQAAAKVERIPARAYLRKSFVVDELLATIRARQRS